MQNRYIDRDNSHRYISEPLTWLWRARGHNSHLCWQVSLQADLSGLREPVCMGCCATVSVLEFWSKSTSPDVVRLIVASILASESACISYRWAGSESSTVSYLHWDRHTSRANGVIASVVFILCTRYETVSLRVILIVVYEMAVSMSDDEERDGDDHIDSDAARHNVPLQTSRDWLTPSTDASYQMSMEFTYL